MRREKTPEEKAKALGRLYDSINQLQTKEGPYYERWLKNYTAWREHQARRV